jgi:hypothetical protein
MHYFSGGTMKANNNYGKWLHNLSTWGYTHYGKTTYQNIATGKAVDIQMLG